MSAKPDRLHRLFRFGMWAKGLDGVMETAGGIALLVTTHRDVVALVYRLVRGELSEDPNDLVAHAILRLAAHLSVGTQTFLTAYLLVHGLVKLGLVGGLLAEKRRIFPVALVVLGLFLTYQVYRLVRTASPWLAILTIVDAAILALVWREWRKLAARTAT